MLKNVKDQTLRVFAFTAQTNAKKLGDAANITCKVSINGAPPVALIDVNPTEVEDGYYLFNLDKAETNGDTLDFYPESATAGVEVIVPNHDRQTIPPTTSGTASPSSQNTNVAPVDHINEAMADAVAAQGAGDYATALKKTEAAWMRMCGLPDSEFENERLEWSRDGLERLLTWLRARVNQTAQDISGGRGAIIRPVEIQYKRG